MSLHTSNPITTFFNLLKLPKQQGLLSLLTDCTSKTTPLAPIAVEILFSHFFYERKD
ncbi:hypothetical protein ACM55K_09120 [Flavobacterium sp. LT1R49]|uniref:hypothetical protein n=1 Tax=Flavobacterium arabinosi TaxID=3398737 RepID=UPI003A83EC35